MNKEKFTSLELSILAFFLLNSFTSTLLINIWQDMKSIEIILSVLLSFIIGLVVIKLYKRNIGKEKKSKLIKIVEIICVFLISIYYLNNVSNIMKTVLLPSKDIFIIELTFILLATILAAKGIKSISIAASLFFFVYVFIAIISFSFNVPNIDPINLLPLGTNLNRLSFLKTTILTTAPLFFLLTIKENDYDDCKEAKKELSVTYILFYIYFLIKILFIISILGIKYYNIVLYPEIEVLKMINIFNLIERFEEILIVNIFIENLIVISISIYYIFTKLNEIKKLNKKYLAFIDIILILILLKITKLDEIYLVISGIIFILVNII